MNGYSTKAGLLLGAAVLALAGERPALAQDTGEARVATDIIVTARRVQERLPKTVRLRMDRDPVSLL